MGPDGPLVNPASFRGEFALLTLFRLEEKATRVNALPEAGWPRWPQFQKRRGELLGILHGTPPLQVAGRIYVGTRRAVSQGAGSIDGRTPADATRADKKQTSRDHVRRCRRGSQQTPAPFHDGNERKRLSGTSQQETLRSTGRLDAFRAKQRSEQDQDACWGHCPQRRPGGVAGAVGQEK